MLDQLATHYGNFVATSRVPTFGYVRRLAAARPRDYAVYVFWNVLIVSIANGVRIGALKAKIRRLEEKNKALTDAIDGDLLGEVVKRLSPEVAENLKETGLL